MIKRIFDIILSLLGLIIAFPAIVIFSLLVWKQDFSNPFYISNRVGMNGKLFKLYKLRSMIVNADASGVDSTGANDSRITKVGVIIRKYKLDEITQLFNVLLGSMSFVGPRPNVQKEVSLYTEKELELLSVRPGITDFSSIVFSDEGDILANEADPDLSYNQLIRPPKGYLGIFYIDNRTLSLDLKLILLTILSIISRKKALAGVHKLLYNLEAPKWLLDISLRNNDLVPMPPIGSDEIVKERN